MKSQDKHMKYAVSACLMGINCKYDGGNNEHIKLQEFLKDKEYILICPEVAGGMSVPRIPCEIKNGVVLNRHGEDMSEYFRLGAQKELQKLKKHKIDVVILQPRSPSCGIGQIYDGSFTKTLIQKNGIFAQACINENITVLSPDDVIYL